jgi:RNA polymerase sigma factor (sigma-70 family)
VVLSDAEFVRAAQNGDVTSLGVLLERHRAPLYALAMQVLGRSPEAMDSVQDTFLIALREIGQLRDPQAAGPWLRTILRNVCLRRLKKGREIFLFGNDVSRFEQGPFESSAEEALDQLVLREWVWTALSELPEALKVTAMLRYFGAYPSYEEVSLILDVPIGTVKSRLNQVKVKLADALLKTAGLAHDEVCKLTEHHVCQYAEFTAAYNRGEVPSEYLSTFADDVVGAIGKWSFRGRKMLTEGLHEDMEAGMKLHPTNVLASEGVLVYEGTFENPPDDPLHCPPALSQVKFIRGGRVQRMRIYHAPRPREDWQDQPQEVPRNG